MYIKFKKYEKIDWSAAFNITIFVEVHHCHTYLTSLLKKEFQYFISNADTTEILFSNYTFLLLTHLE